MGFKWPHKIVPDFTDEELVDAIEQNEHSADPVTRQMTQSCIQEWRERWGLKTDDD